MLAGPLPDRRPARPRRDGRGLPGRRPEARQPVALKFLPRALAGRPRPARAALRRGAHRAPGRRTRTSAASTTSARRTGSTSSRWSSWTARTSRRCCGASAGFPQDKALEIARQVCAGLAAAHDEGRAAPRPEARERDARRPGPGAHHRLRAGRRSPRRSRATRCARARPPTWRPSSCAGARSRVRSDIYALGLVLYELFTGRRAFEGNGFAELDAQHRDEQAARARRRWSPGLDPAVERAILRCLEKDPRQRPALGARGGGVLPGGDPLAAALAAGETPSPEMVAAAGETGGLRPRVARGLPRRGGGGVLVFAGRRGAATRCIARPGREEPGGCWRTARASCWRGSATRSGPSTPTRGLRDRPRLPALGRAQHDRRRRAGQRSRRARRRSCSSGTAQSPRPLVGARTAFGRVRWRRPAASTSPAWRGVRYDLRGRLVTFYAVPPQVETAPARAAAGRPTGRRSSRRRGSTRGASGPSSRAGRRPSTPTPAPPGRAPARTRPEIPLRIEAAGYRGRPVWFEMQDAWTRAERDVVSPLTAAQRRDPAFSILSSPRSSPWLVPSPIATSRSAAATGVGRSGWRSRSRRSRRSPGSLRAHHAPSQRSSSALIAHRNGLSLLVSAIVWLLYLALEPYVRRLRPWTLVSWTRLLNGGVRDPVVGRDVLAGLAYGTGLALLNTLARTLVAYLGYPERSARALRARREALHAHAAELRARQPGRCRDVGGLALLLLFLVLRLVTRKDWIAASLVVGLHGLRRLRRRGE